MTADNTPILVGAGQYVEKEKSLQGPLSMAAHAARAAIEDCAGSNVAQAIDTVAMVRMFADSSPMWRCPFGGSDNPPATVANSLGLTPSNLIYSQVGGIEPMTLVFEQAAAIARGERHVALLFGAEALRNQKHAQRSGAEPDWSDTTGIPLEDRGEGAPLFSMQEIHVGLMAPVYFYSLIDQARRHRQGLSVEAYRASEARLFASFSAIASGNPNSQFDGCQSAADILSADPLTHLYTKRMVAQDGVNQAAALVMCSVAKARELGIPESRWVYLHSGAAGADRILTEREDPGRSSVAEAVVSAACDAAQLAPEEADLVDIYSCFPCAVTAITDHLGLPDDGSRPLSLTGGLPYFGGPGNNYTMHALAEMVGQIRGLAPSARALITANAGMLSKHAAAVFGRAPGALDWSRSGHTIIPTPKGREVATAPESGRVLTYTLNYLGDNPVQVIALAETPDGQRFACCSEGQDTSTLQEALNSDPTGREIVARPGEKDGVYFRFA